MLDIGMKGHILSIFCGRSPRRGAWIEILSSYSQIYAAFVAPRVGERGLKYRVDGSNEGGGNVAPRVGERGLKCSAVSPRLPGFRSLPA